ncbi:putative Universal stress protein UspA [Nitrospira sp. KM1]|uniref:universal stress protein n=1 Tax=Nitrospira sp. KM1 TaxID=1936990 RepID=UPI0013A7329A|nr:putative Universal stress protein UspA [Nitrospira sp. KM1]
MKTLVATDGSKHGQWAIEWMARLPFITPPTVRVLHVVDLASLRAPFLVQPMVAGTEHYIRAEAERLERTAKTTRKSSATLLKSLHLRGGVMIERGPVAATITKHADRGYGLLSIGSRGLDSIDRFMLGSVSEHAIHHAPCSVLVVKEAPRSIKRILIATDGSPSSTKAIQYIVKTFSAPSRTGRSKPIAVSLVYTVPALEYPEIGRSVVKTGAALFLKSGFAVQSTVRVGKPAVEILKAAQESKADLIVTGAKGLGAIRRMLLGSVSTRVVRHATCSVLVVR